MTKKHFLALVPMGGEYTGKIGQHSTMQETFADATEWANGRFSRPFVIVEMEHGQDSLDTDTAIAEYNKAQKKSNYYVKPICLFTTIGKRIIWIAGDNTYSDNSVSFMSYDAKVNMKTLELIHISDKKYAKSKLKTINSHIADGTIIEQKIMVSSVVMPFVKQ